MTKVIFSAQTYGKNGNIDIPNVGFCDGDNVCEGAEEGDPGIIGLSEGWNVGSLLGDDVGVLIGFDDGNFVGERVGIIDGFIVGAVLIQKKN